MRIRTAGKGIVGVAAMATATWASVAFACSPMPRVYSALPESASPGSTVMVEGRDVAAPAPIEIRWNGAKGEVLATATAGSNGAFSVPVRVPDVAPGIYSLTLVAPGGGVGRTAFEVTGPAVSATSSPAGRLWPTGTSPASIAAPASSGGAATAGVALLSLGLVGLAAGTTIAVTRRRRVLARVQP